MQIATIGLDIAKNVFQVHGIDAAEKVVVRKQLRRSQVLAFFEAPPPCLVGLRHSPLLGAWTDEAWPPGSSDAGERREGIVKRNKNDAADAEAVTGFTISLSNGPSNSSASGRQLLPLPTRKRTCGRRRVYVAMPNSDMVASIDTVRSEP